MQKRARVVLAVGIALLATWTVRAEIIEQILVKVNGEIFTKTDLEARQVAALRQSGRDLDPNTDDAKLREMLDEVTPDLMVSVVDEMLIVQRGRDLGYRLNDERFTEIVKKLKEDNKIENDEQFQAALKQENMTMADLRRNLERQMIVSQVQQNEVMGRIAVNDEEAKAYYDQHREEFTSPASVTLREIFVTVPGDGQSVNVGADEEAREKAEAIRTRAVNGEDFEKLAADLSDAPSRANAGLIGPLSLDDLAPELRKVIGGMKPGEVTELLRAKTGYQILKLESLTTAETMPFEKAREEISNRVFTDKRREEFNKYLERLRSEGIIEWKNAEIRKAYERGLERIKTGAKDPA